MKCLKSLKDFPRGPVVKNPPCNAGGRRFLPDQGTKTKKKTNLHSSLEQTHHLYLSFHLFCPFHHLQSTWTHPTCSWPIPHVHVIHHHPSIRHSSPSFHPAFHTRIKHCIRHSDGDTGGQYLEGLSFYHEAGKIIYIKDQWFFKDTSSEDVLPKIIHNRFIKFKYE